MPISPKQARELQGPSPAKLAEIYEKIDAILGRGGRNVSIGTHHLIPDNAVEYVLDAYRQAGWLRIAHINDQRDGNYIHFAE